MKFVVTAGPTREFIDDVRFISNASSGRMGFALARATREAGHDVTLVSGPTALEPPEGVECVKVTSAEDMVEAALAALDGADVLVSAAAIADFKPEKARGKIKSGGELTLKLAPTRKLTREARQKFPELFIAAFKAEYGATDDELLEAARGKLLSEGLDLIAANDLKENEFGSSGNEVVVVGRDGKVLEKFKGSKLEVARALTDSISRAAAR